MRSFTYYSPTKIVFGVDAQLQVGACVSELAAKKVLIVYGSERVVKSGLLGQVTDSLERAGVQWDKLGGVVANPHLSLAREGVRKAIEMQADLILAVGGGSVIDTAKCVAVGAANPQTDVWEFWSGRQKFTKARDVASVLTLAAAGSETSDSCVITNTQTGEKRGVNNDCMRPKFAIMNPELTYSLPRKQVAAGVTDIIMHTLERYFTPIQGNHMSDAFAEGLIRVMLRFGPVGLENSHDYEAMSEIMWAGSLSHIDLTGLGCKPPNGRAGDWATHQLGHELSGMFDSTHGETLSTMWGAWARYVCDADYARFAQFGRNVFGIAEADDAKAAHAAIDAMVAFLHERMGMPTCFSELGIGVLPAEKIDELADNCAFHKTRTIGAFKKLDCEDIRKIYSAANR